MLSKRFTLVTLCAVLSLPGAMAIAKDGPHPPQGAEREQRSPELRVAHQLDRLRSHVELSDTQQQDIAALLTTRHETLETMKPRRDDHRGQLTALLSAETIDRRAVRSFHAQRRQEAAEHHEVFMESMLDIAEVLTVEQRQEAADWLLHLGRPPRHRPTHGPGQRPDHQGRRSR